MVNTCYNMNNQDSAEATFKVVQCLRKPHVSCY